MRQLKTHSIFFILLATLLFSNCGQLGLSGILGGSGLMGASGDEAGFEDGAWADEADVIDLDDEGDSQGYAADNGFSGASNATGDGYYYYDSANDDDGLVEGESDGSHLMGTGSLSPENMPVTMSKLFPEDGTCDESSENNVVGVATDGGDGTAYMMAPPPEDEESESSHARSSHRRHTARFYFTPSTLDADFTESAYQCQYTGTDPETGEEFFEWVEIDIEDFLDIIEEAGLRLDFDSKI